MKLLLNRRRLQESLSLAMRAITVAKTILASRCVLIAGHGGSWSMSAADHQLAIDTRLTKTSDEETPEGVEAFLFAHQLNDALKTVNGYPTVEFDTEPGDTSFVDGYSGGSCGNLNPILARMPGVRVTPTPGREDDPVVVWEYRQIDRVENGGIDGAWVEPADPGIALPNEDWCRLFDSTRGCQGVLNAQERRSEYTVDATALDALDGFYYLVAGTAMSIAAGKLVPLTKMPTPCVITKRAAGLIHQALDSHPLGASVLKWTDRATRLTVTHLGEEGTTTITAAREAGRFMPWQGPAKRDVGKMIAFQLGDLQAAMRTAGCAMNGIFWWLFRPMKGECQLLAAEEFDDLKVDVKARRMKAVGKATFKIEPLAGPLPGQCLFSSRAMEWTNCGLPKTERIEMYIAGDKTCRAVAREFVFLISPGVERS